VFEAGFVLGKLGLDVLLSEESQKPTAKFLLLVATWFRGIAILRGSESESRTKNA